MKQACNIVLDHTVWSIWNADSRSTTEPGLEFGNMQSWTSSMAFYPGGGGGAGGRLADLYM